MPFEVSALFRVLADREEWELAESAIADPELEQEIEGESSLAPDGSTPADETDDLGELDLDALLRQGMSPAETTPPPDEDTEDPTGLLDAEDAEGAPAGDEEAHEGAPTAAADMATWIENVRGKSARISEVPGQHRGAVVDAILADRDATHATNVADIQAQARQAVADAYQRGVEEAQRQAVITQEVAAIDELRESDPEAFVRWEDEYPDRAAAYRSIKEQRRQPVKVDAQAAEQAVVYQLAAKQIERLQAVPGAHDAFLAANAQSRKVYAPTTDGVSDLANDVTELLADLKAQSKLKADEPAREAAARRQAQAAANRALPKAPGTGTPPADDLASSNNVNDLLAAGFRSARR